ncbi:MAG: ABC transporter permease, partial [Coriobacteriales bacterium]|nr:ABC transporter permease [Coriobacteriales bacterium]
HVAPLINIIAGGLNATHSASSSGSSASIKNDLASFKKYLDSNPKNLNNYVDNIEYTYRTSPVIYYDNINGKGEVFPKSGLFGSLGSGSGRISVNGTSEKQGSASSINSTRSLQSYGPLPKDPKIYKDDDCLVAGQWPQNSHELLLVLNPNGTIDDNLLYDMGMRDYNTELKPVIEKYLNGEPFEYAGLKETYPYTDFLGKTFKMINPSECYAYNSSTGLWEDQSLNPEYMEPVINNGQELKIVGVVFPKFGTRCYTYLNAGINFPFDLYEESIKETTNSPIVQAQLASPETDVLSGESFSYLAGASKIFNEMGGKKLLRFDLEKLLSSIKINPEALDFKDIASKEPAVSEEEQIALIVKILEDPAFIEFIYDITKDGTFEEDVLKLTAQAAQKYMEYVSNAKAHGLPYLSSTAWFSDAYGGKQYIDEMCAQLPKDMMNDAAAFLEKYGPVVVDALIEQISDEISELIANIGNELFDEDRPDLIEFDMEKFSTAIGTDITMNDLRKIGCVISGSAGRTLKGNLADFGYDDLSDPATVTIYPKDYPSKTNVITIIDSYNEDMQNTKQEDKIVTYTDDSGDLIKMAQGLVSGISGVILFFVLASTLSSILLLGIIFGVNTIRRRREIGLVRALGGRGRDVGRMFNVENAYIGFCAGVVGVLLAVIVSFAINSVANLGFNIAVLAPGVAIALIVISTLLAFVAGLLPSIFAGKKDPVRAINGL